jgi:acetyltransferase-like isoleucine patch superfamily enzyme
LAPGTTLTGCVKIGRFSFIGAAASVIPNVTIGEEAIIGARSFWRQDRLERTFLMLIINPAPALAKL